ncbi:hypothetical protein JCM11641_004691 [Rhodosporidiobolus odoratus]
MWFHFSFFFPVLFLTTLVFASPRPSSTIFTPTLTKRDSTSDFSGAYQAGEALASSAAEMISSGGPCSETCSEMIGLLARYTSSDDQLETSQCICSTTTLKEVDGCGKCLIGDSVGQAESRLSSFSSRV